MAVWKILVADAIQPNGLALLQAGAEVDNRAGIAAAELLEVLPGYHALIVGQRTRVSAVLIQAARDLKVIGRAGVGIDNIDLAAANLGGITVVTTPNATVAAVAEHTLALMFALARAIPRADAAMKNGQWNQNEPPGVELHGKQLGVIGVGSIGSAVCQRAAALGMTALGYDPLLPPEEIVRRGAQPTSLGALYARADFISLHLPLTVETRHMIGGQALAQMKRGVRLICTARGGLIDETALLGALETGQLAGAALDVFPVEPPGLTALVSHPRVVVTPHIAAQTVEAQVRAAEDIAQEVLAALNGLPLRWKVV